MTFRRYFSLIVLVALSSIASAQYFPKTGRAAVYQRSLDVRGRLHVLSIALRPGYEDLATLAYFRMGQGAQIISAYVTNGETGESDVRGEYPTHLAAIRRTEASEALRLLDGGAMFFNMQDIVAASDSSSIYSLWRTDTLRSRLMRVMADFRPDVILIARDWLGGAGSPQLQVVRGEVLRVVRGLASANIDKSIVGVGPVAAWHVARVLIDDGSKDGARTDVDKVHPLWKKSYDRIGEEAAQKYVSISLQRRNWLADAFGDPATNAAIHYRQLYPARKSPLRKVDQDLPAQLPSTMTNMEKGITALTTATLKGDKTIVDPAGKKEDVLAGLVQVIAPLDKFLKHVFQLSPEEMKIGLQWKQALEDLRLALLGVDVRYTLDEKVFTERQVAQMTIDTITGLRPGGRSYLYFPLVDEKGWIVNEAPYKQVNFEFHELLRLLSPQKLEYNLPANIYGIQRSAVAGVFPFYVIHEGAKMEESFMTRIDIPVKYAPRFTAETLTPVVAAVPNERIVVELTNNSRDGVRDSVVVDDSLATSPKREFRLSVKGATHVDTLMIHWNQPLGEGTYTIPVKINRATIATFAARRFNVNVDTLKWVALFTGIEASPTADALRRLGVPYQTFTDAPRHIEDLTKFQTVIVDRRALTLKSSFAEIRPLLEQFVARGGRIIILAQDARTWNARPLMDGLMLTQSPTAAEEAAVDADSTNRLMTTPNAIHRDDWMGWLFQRSYNAVSGTALNEASIPVRAERDRNPLVLQWKKGSGTVIYTDLALQPQFLNVHAGVYRLLANLLSY